MIRIPFVIAVAGAVAVTGLLPTSLSAAPADAPPARSLEQIREGALAAMHGGELQQVQKRGGNRARSRSFRGGGRAGARSFRGARSFGGARSFRGRTAYRRGYSGGRRYYGRGGRRGYGGAAIAAGVIGLAAGAAIASGARSSGYRSSSWCAERYKSYDPRSGTYLGYDGLRHRCP